VEWILQISFSPGWGGALSFAIHPFGHVDKNCVIVPPSSWHGGHTFQNFRHLVSFLTLSYVAVLLLMQLI